MSLTVNNLNKEGDASKEYVLLQATADINLNNYAVVDRTYDEDGKVSDVYKHFFRFPSQEVKKGEYVSLRSGTGSYETGDIKGTKVHRFYWQSEGAIWNDDKAERVEVLKVSTIATRSTDNPAPTPKKKLKTIPRFGR